MTIMASCSQSNEDKAKTLINEYMKENLKDPSSYEPVSFSQLDSLFFPYIDTDEGSKLFKLGGMSGEYYKKASEFRHAEIYAKTRAEVDMLNDSIKYYEQKSKEFEEIFKENSKNYEGEFIGWKLNHEYRAKNGFGALDLDRKDFYFDKELTKIVPPYGRTRNSD